MKQDEEDKNDLKRMAPNLAALPRVNPFRVPDGYFRQLEEHVMGEIQERTAATDTTEPHGGFDIPAGYFEALPSVIQNSIAEKKSARIRPLLPQPAYAVGIAAAFLAMLLLTRPALWFEEPNPTAVTLTVEELGNSTYLAELDEHVLIEALGDYEAGASTERNADAEVEYLLENNIDLNQILEE